MGDVIEGRFVTKADISPDSMLEAAIGQLDEVIIVGTDKNGDLYLATSDGSIPNAMFLLKLAEVRLLEETMR